MYTAMAWLQHYSVLFFCLLAIFAESSPFHEFGVITVTNGTYKFVGDSLEMYCNITSTALRENSSMLHFERWTKKDKNVIPKEYIETLTTKTIRLRLPNVNISDDGVYTCFLQMSSGDVKIIDSQTINVDYKPKQVKDLSCRVYNWEQMNCTWDLGVKFKHPEYVNVSLVWTIDGDQYDCPKMTKTSCLWNSDLYTHGHQYLMVIEVSINVNGLVLMTERSPQFRIETMLYETFGIVTLEPDIIVKIVAYVEPAPVDNLQANVVNSSCVELRWLHSATGRSKFFVAESRKADEDKWSQIILNQEAERSCQSVVCSLVPFTNYEFRMSVLPYPIETKEPVNQGHRSEWRTVAAKTFEDVPGVSPKICSGCFHDFKCPQNRSLRCVKIYWQDLKKNEKHGVLKEYNITYASSDYGISSSLLLPVVASKTLTSANLTLPVPSQNFQISICPATSQGFSRSSSSFLLPSVQRKPNAPPSFLVEMDNKNERKDVFYLSWAALNVDAKTGQKYTNITIVWCPGITSETECRGDIDWVQLPADQVTFELKLEAEEQQHSDFLIGITAEVFTDGQAVSSGIYWSTCTYHRNEPPQNHPKNVRESSKHPNQGLTILWDKFECHEEKSFITEYLIKYCPSDEDKRCYEPERSQNVSNTAGEVTLDNLKVDARYMVTVIAISSAGLGPSKSVLTIPVHGVAPGPDVTGPVGITGGVVLCLLFLFILIMLVRHCFRRKKKLPNTGDLIQPYAQSPVDFSNKIHARQGFQNRPLPKTPEEQDFYGSSACMNNPGSDKTAAADNHNSESNSEQSVNSQTDLISTQAQINKTQPTKISSKSHSKTNSPVKEFKEMKLSPKEAKSLLKNNSSGNTNGLSDTVNNSNNLEQNIGLPMPQDYTTVGYVSNNNDIYCNKSQRPKVDNASDGSSFSSTIQSSSENLPDYHFLAEGSSKSISHPDPSLISFSNTGTLPLREFSRKMSDGPSQHTGQQIFDPFFTSITVGQGEVIELSQPTNKSKKLGFSQKCPTSSSHFHSAGEATVLSLSLTDSLSKGNKSEYIAHSQMACQPNDLLKNNQPVDYARFAEIPENQRHSDSIQECLHLSPSPTSSSPSSCIDDTHCTPGLVSLSHCHPSYFSSDTQSQFSFNTSIPHSLSIAQTSITPINDYTPWKAFPKAEPITEHSALSTCPTAALDEGATAYSLSVMNISPTVNFHDYVDHLPHVSSLPNEEERTTEICDYNSAGLGATFPRTVGRDSLTLNVPISLTRPLSGDLLQLPPEYYEDPKLGESHEIFTEL